MRQQIQSQTTRESGGGGALLQGDEGAKASKPNDTFAEIVVTRQAHL